MNVHAAVSAWDEGCVASYQTFLCAAGYESRSKFAAKRLLGRANRRIAVGFDYHHQCSLDENVNWFRENNFFDWNNGSPCFASNEEFQSIACRMLDPTQFADRDEVYLAVDISSFSSVRLAFLVEKCWELGQVKDVVIDFLYAPGRNYNPKNSNEQIEFAGPVNRRLAGWSSEPEMPVVGIFGLGHEYDRSIGAFEYLNPSLSYTFSTHGANEALAEKIKSYHNDDAELGRRIQEANRQLLPLVPPELRFTFDVGRPLDCYNMVRSVAIGAMRYGRPVFVPLGPKLFALCSIAVATEFYPRIAVWRISTGRQGAPTDVHARGDLVGLRFRLRRIA